ncbi:hypothetical protein GMD78_10260 [Ornithinibacillus sp. L9]|uniref:ABC-2 type transport system permease protein n=1 Tax=Ornithinibacillus caprae TaxID=2678566 RepID=A0A6N8FH53_9BACI|nr:hypothetical protein [Ornithinibacillus caprae]MUK88775.1 hypothetical protein [Ornithinibacillus caprae]
MSKTWIVMKNMLKIHYSRAGNNNSQIILLSIAGIFLFPFLFFYLGLINNAVSGLYELLEPFGQSSVIIGLLFLLLTALLFIISFVLVISSFYFAEDINSFIPLPIQPYQILLGKATVPLLYLYVTTFAIYFPVLFYFGSNSNASIVYYLLGIILFVFLPFIPFVLAAIFVMFIMRFVNIAKNKDRSKVLGGIFVLLMIILLNVVVRLNANPDEMMENFAQFIQEKDGLLQMITAAYPPALIGSKALTVAGWESLLYFLLMISISIGFIFLFIIVGQKLYLGGVLGINVGNKKNISSERLHKKLRKHPVWLSYLQKELRIIFRTPTFFMQCVVQSLFGPIFLVIILMMDSNFNSLSGTLDQFSYKQQILILFAATLFILSANATGISSISREGKSWHTNLFLPLDLKQVFLSKIAAGWTINLVSILLIAIGLIVVLDISWLLFSLWLALSFVASWFTSLMGTYLDFSHPKLHWTDEQEVFKARLIGFLALLFEFVPLGIIVVIIWNTPFVQGGIVTFVLLLLLMFIATALVHYLLQKKISNKDYQKII